MSTFIDKHGSYWSDGVMRTRHTKFRIPVGFWIYYVAVLSVAVTLSVFVNPMFYIMLAVLAVTLPIKARDIACKWGAGLPTLAQYSNKLDHELGFDFVHEEDCTLCERKKDWKRYDSIDPDANAALLDIDKLFPKGFCSRCEIPLAYDTPEGIDKCKKCRAITGETDYAVCVQELLDPIITYSINNRTGQVVISDDSIGKVKNEVR